MRPLIQVLFARTLVVFLALQVADTPVFCADERPTETGVRTDSHSAAPSGDLHASSGSIDSDSVSCFCPCHLTFESEATYSLASTTEPTAVNPVASPRTPPESPQELDHPPQNLG